MNLLKKVAAAAAAAAIAMVGSVTVATPALASDVLWINQDKVLSISNARTALSVDTPRGTVQIRYGTYNGVQYGWGRALNAPAGYTLVFEADTNGDRIMDEGATAYLTGSSAVWTWGASTSASSARAFRACILSSSQMSCSETSSRTGWW